MKDSRQIIYRLQYIFSHKCIVSCVLCCAVPGGARTSDDLYFVNVKIWRNIAGKTQHCILCTFNQLCFANEYRSTKDDQYWMKYCTIGIVEFDEINDGNVLERAETIYMFIIDIARLYHCLHSIWWKDLVRSLLFAMLIYTLKWSLCWSTDPEKFESVYANLIGYLIVPLNCLADQSVSLDVIGWCFVTLELIGLLNHLLLKLFQVYGC